ncbi:MAG: glycosyltransferase family 2 protein [Deltaproteobacteria bacterium]|nr:glycosyltransferase family 2 protein [Deltaproteobacteria bacterium]MBW2192239.1 glycosyltransferase family 2 protein [Deltaproteobacteria bacterium]
MKPKACIILPTYNEAENVAFVISSIFEQARKTPSHDLHVLVVDDNSPDGTQNIVCELMDNRFENLHLITGEKKGLGEAYKRGMQHAIDQLSPDLIFEMDADRQHDSSLIPLFVLLANHGFSLVIGSRFAPGGSTPDFSIYRKTISLLGNWMVRFFGGIPRIQDCTSGYRCIKAELIPKCNFEFLSTRGYSFQSSFLCELLRNGAKVIEVPIVFPDRLYGESKLSIKDQVEFLINIVKIRFQRSEEFIKFGVVGMSGVFVNLGFYILLTRKIGIDLKMAAPVAIELSILSNFFFNHVWTFKNRNTSTSLAGKIVKFHLTSGIAGIVNYIVFLSAVYLLSFHDVFANLCGIGAGVFINYFVNSLWTWRKIKHGADQSQ